MGCRPRFARILPSLFPSLALPSLLVLPDLFSFIRRALVLVVVVSFGHQTPALASPFEAVLHLWELQRL